MVPIFLGGFKEIDDYINMSDYPEPHQQSDYLIAKMIIQKLSNTGLYI
jgi:hypothetical protein